MTFDFCALTFALFFIEAPTHSHYSSRASQMAKGKTQKAKVSGAVLTFALCALPIALFFIEARAHQNFFA